MKAISLIINLMILLITHYCYGNIDTLTNYDNEKGIIYYKNINAIFYARFDLEQPVLLKSIDVTLTGARDLNGIKLRIYGEEGGIAAPLLESDLIKPITFYKKKEGIEKISIPIDDYLILSGKQFFVCIEDLNEGVYLVSDLVAKRHACIDKYGEYFYFQLIKSIDKNGQYVWTYGNFGFAIDCIIENINQEKDIFNKISKHNITIDTNAVKTNAAFLDYNNDNLIDVLINGKLFINLGNFKFQELEEFSSYKTDANLNFVLDVNNDGLLDYLFLGLISDSVVSDIEHLLLIQDNKGNFVRKNIESFDFANINSFTLVELNDDRNLDIIFTKGNIYEQTEKEIDNTDLFLLSAQNSNLVVNNSYFNYQNSEKSFHTKVIITDYNYDGKPDIIFNNFNGFPIYIKYGLYGYELDREKTFFYEEIEYLDNLYSFSIEPIDISNYGNMVLLPVVEYQRSNLSYFKTIETNQKDMYKSELLDTYNNNLIFQDSFQGIISGDIDNNSYIDLITLPNNDCHNSKLYFNNNGNLYFVSNSGLNNNNLGNEGILIDLNNDGLLDLFKINMDGVDIYQNMLETSGNFIKIKANSQNINQFTNSTVNIFVDNKRITRQFTPNSGFLIQSPMELIIGTGENNIIDSLYVNTWYNNEFKREILRNIDLNLMNNIELDYSTFESYEIIEEMVNVFPNPFNQGTTFELYSNNQCSFTLEVYNYLGQKVFKKHGNINKQQFKRLKWSPDRKTQSSTYTYFYTIKICDKLYQGKIIQIN